MERSGTGGERMFGGDFSKLDFNIYTQNIDFWKETMEVELPNWAEELDTMGFEPISAVDFYDDIFGLDLEPSRMPEDYQTGEYGAIALELQKVKQKDGKTRIRGHRYTITQDLQTLHDLIDNSKCNCYIAPISYAGRKRCNVNARYLYALCIEIDNIQPNNGLTELFYTFKRDNRPIPRPTYIVCSGNGLHLYWKFERPIPLFKNIFEQLQAIKKYMTRNLWDKQISKSWKKIQYEPLCQAFRCVGTIGKNKHKRAMAFKVGEELSIEKFNERLPKKLQMNVIYKSNLPKEKAKELYPEWYQRRVVEGQPRGHYNRAEGIYYNWIEKIMDTDKGAEVGHRYNCLENLCSLAVQCQIAPEQVEADCRRVAEYLETLTETEDNHFTEYDILCALKTYHNASEMAYRRRIDIISEKTGITLVPNKRNGVKQEWHLEDIRQKKANMKRRGQPFKNPEGRPTKQEIVCEWQASHPGGRKCDCRRDTGLSKPTIDKWWGTYYVDQRKFWE